MTLYQNPSMHDDWRNNNKMSRTTSATYSISSSSSRQTNTSIPESSAKTYVAKLENYLYSLLEKESAEGVPPQRSTARQKLSRLNNIQFHELATDVYDELTRRTMDSRQSFLPVRDDFHPRRNQARQKLGTLPTSRFRDLASDVYHELKRRYPHIVDDMPPLPKLNTQGLPSQSTNIIPVKGMMSVETINISDDEDNIDNLMSDLGKMVKSPPPSIHPLESQSKSQNLTNENEGLEEYERKIEAMTNRIKMLELALEKESSGSPGLNADRDRQMKIKQMQDEYKKLDSKYSQLNKEHTDQQQAVKEVKGEIKQLIDELKSLSKSNETLRMQNEKADEEIKQLIQENKSWKRKYETISMELKRFRVESVDFDKQDLANDFFLKPNPKGAIDQQFIIDYQAAIDDLMQTSRSSNPSDVLTSMRNIVMACKSITTEVEEYEVNIGLSLENKEALYEIKKNFTNDLTNLLIASKSFANGMGISPVSLVDAAAGNLSTTIVDLVKLLGMKPIQNNNDLQKKSVSNATPMTPAKLSEFLKTETDHIVSAVQDLLAALRSNDDHLVDIVNSIVNTVSNIVQSAKLTFSVGEGLKYKNQGSLLVDDLDRCKQKITQIRDTAFTKSSENATAKRNLAQEAYEIAKYTKELIHMLDM